MSIVQEAEIESYLEISNEFGSIFVDLLIDARPHEETLSRVMSDLFDFTAGRINAILTLMREGALWDAEMLMRTVLETTVKQAYICSGTSEQRAVSLDEYCNALPELNALSQSVKAKKSLKATAGSDVGTESLIEALILPDEREAEIRERWPRKTRATISSKWSFTQMLSSIEQQSTAMPGFKALGGLITNYGISSHLLHGDESGIGIIKDRRRREEEERALMDLAHCYNLLDGIVVCTMVSAIAMKNAVGGPVELLHAAHSKWLELVDSRRKVAVELAERWTKPQ